MDHRFGSLLLFSRTPRSLLSDLEYDVPARMACAADRLEELTRSVEEKLPEKLPSMISNFAVLSFEDSVTSFLQMGYTRMALLE